MISNKRRIIIGGTSLAVGTVLSVLLMISRKGKLSVNDYATLMTNVMLAAAIVVVIGVLFRNKAKDK